MAIYIPIVSEFKSQGIDKARKEFQSLEGVGQKTAFAMKKAFLPAVAVVGALGAAGKSALAAGEEVNSANNRIGQIAKSMDLFGDSTDYVQKRLVKMAEAQGVELGISNLTIKATQAKLLTFKNLAKTANVTGGAFDRANKAALDMAAAGFGSAEGNAVQLGKALEDPIKGVTALAKSGVTFNDVEKEKIKNLTESGKILEAQEIILKAVETQVGGTAAATADDSARMKEGFAQVSQALGMTLLPILEAVTPVMLGIANWAKENPGTFKLVAAAIGGIALAIIAINFAMAANPLVLIVLGIAALIGILVVAYKRFEGFRKIVDLVFAGLKMGVSIAIENFQMMMGVIKTIFNGIATLWNNTFGKLSITIPNIPGLPGRGQTFSIPKIPMLADGGLIMNGATLAVVGEAGPEAVIPLNRISDFMDGGGGNSVTINVHGGDPQAVVDALRRYMRTNGAVPIRVATNI
jgi:hypothetical protein